MEAAVGDAEKHTNPVEEHPALMNATGQDQQVLDNPFEGALACLLFLCGSHVAAACCHQCARRYSPSAC